MKPLLTRLDEQLGVCTDPLQRAELLAERACYLARIGRFAEANEIATSLRRDYGDGRSARISVWVMLLEGLVLYFDKVRASAYDRIWRASTISVSLRLPRLSNLAGIWLAHIEFERSNYNSMAQLVSTSLSMDETRPEVLLRAGIVLGDAYLYLGLRREAQVWYDVSRRCALDLGDQAAVGALMYNRAVFGLAALRITSHLADANVDDHALRMVEMELDSACSFQIGSQVKSLPHLFDVCRAQIHLLARRWPEAAGLLTKLHSQIDELEDRKNKQVFLIDLIWSFLMMGRLKQAEVLVAEIELNSYEGLDVDDRVVLFSTLVKIYARLKHKREMLAAQNAYEAARKSCLEERAILLEALKGLEVRRNS